MENKDFQAAMRRLRDQVSSHPLRPTLMANTDSWTTLCDAMDTLQDWQGDSPAEILAQQEAMDTIRLTLGIEGLDWEESTEPQTHQAALQASLEAVNAELGDRANAHFEQFDGDPLTPLLEGSAYASSQVARVVAKHDRGSGTSFEEAGLRGLRRQLEAVREGLVARRLDEPHHAADLDDALFILQTVEQSLGDGPGNDRLREVDLLARVALPALMSEIESLVANVDEGYRERRAGWKPQ